MHTLLKTKIRDFPYPDMHVGTTVNQAWEMSEFYGIWSSVDFLPINNVEITKTNNITLSGVAFYLSLVCASS